ncbi:MAG TPA: hypothetical protein VHO25_15825 [Polyangiaceae bacterium]|nr:hypothetical protein [Polyangiaceae bacterium]
MPSAVMGSQASGGVAAVQIEIANGAVNGVNTQFVFVGVPFAVMRNGVIYSPGAYSVAGNTATIAIPPLDGEITGLTTAAS